MADKATIVLFSHVSNSRSITGAEKLLLFFGRELSPYFNCILVAPQEGKLTRLARKSGMNVELLPIPLVYGMYTPYAGLEADIRKFQEGREYLELCDWLTALRPAFIISSTCVHALPAMAAKSLGIPVVWKISETITDNEFTPLSVELIHRNSDEILAISHTAAACFPEEIRELKVTQLPPSWDDKDMMLEAWSMLRGERRRELKVAPNEPLIGYISSFINKEKGLEHFVKMAVQVSALHSDAKFLVIGTPGDKNYYDRCVRKVKLEGLNAKFQFAGYEECLPAAYCAMDILVVPSLIREGFGMTALEGMAFGKPVVAYDSGGLREILLAAGCGDQLAPAENIAALAERVNALLAAPGYAAGVGSMARERIVAVYGPDAYRARLQGLAERWYLRYCQAQPQPPCAEPAAAPEITDTVVVIDEVPAAAVPAGGDPGGSAPAAAGAPAPPQALRRRLIVRRRLRLRRGKLRRGRLRRAAARARRAARPARKRRAVKPARRKSGGGKQRRQGHRARRGVKRRRKAA
ncbi:glycosyl transferase family 1 [Paenibacillus sp. PK3_47]|uniref:glycosyltransferase family 4 protein n=1 Tax=Paenibacillus sp. PK3_47 TaxID=2072642 RepID=UPI00201D6DA4|nr:glycosyltransferase family 4 protein [Paenibacillus sp. PK3_47]UQZ33227.1 glycosyl transferase family 1 [Paenibacillus sp. PK3_47]